MKNDSASLLKEGTSTNSSLQDKEPWQSVCPRTRFTQIGKWLHTVVKNDKFYSKHAFEVEAQITFRFSPKGRGTIARENFWRRPEE